VPAPAPHTPPDRPTPPPLLSKLTPGWSATLAYQLVPAVRTWRLTHPDGRVRFAKEDTAGEHPTLVGEAERMVWAAPYLPVPVVVALEQTEGCTILITEALPGLDGTDSHWDGDVPGLVRAFAEGLASFHAAVGEEWCPFRFHNDAALEHVHRRIHAGLIDPARTFEREFSGLTVAAALALLEESVPGIEDLVVCHGDYCPPNVLLTGGSVSGGSVSGGKVTGFVDLGEMGVADRWRDIAIGAWSTGWNFGPEYEPLFYEGYGVVPDPERIRFYRLLWSFAS
jgi:kanamycin kinase